MAIETVNETGKPEIAIAPLGVKIPNGTVGSEVSNLNISLLILSPLLDISLPKMLKRLEE